MNLMAKICNMIISTSVISTDDSGNYPVVVTRFFGKTVRSQALLPYGVVSRCPSGGLATRFLLMGKESNSMAMCADPRNRMKNLNEGEIGLYNQTTQSFVLLRGNGDVEVNAQGNVIANATGDIQAEASSATITASTVTINGNLVVDGNITNTGNIASDGTIDSGTISLEQHTHPYTWTDPAGSGSTGVPQ